ncbi:hypothetical protein AAFF_G00313290 [Aldrovandia affinis]|uniref:Uncharacterized protein n=1 Tax=Aldrovandia affinis TaxID=143900 RepID=A0AAD7SPR8_9TELE|nr:hypothetical protein AAFF_G00313290 [Aldrovandia affinis]
MTLYQGGLQMVQPRALTSCPVCAADPPIVCGRRSGQRKRASASPVAQFDAAAGLAEASCGALSIRKRRERSLPKPRNTATAEQPMWSLQGALCIHDCICLLAQLTPPI